MEPKRFIKSVFISGHSKTRLNEFAHILLGTILLFFIALTMMSCAEKSGHLKTQEWVGHHRDELTTLRGLPSHEAPLADGRRSLVYQRQGGPVNHTRDRCRTVFITDSKGIILGAGDYSCSSMPK